MLTTKLTRLFFAILLLSLSASAVGAAGFGFLDDLVGLLSEQRDQLATRIQQNLGAVAEKALSAEQARALNGIVSAGIFEFQEESEGDDLTLSALTRIGQVAALSYRALAAGLHPTKVEEIAQAALGFDLTDDIFQAAVRTLDRLDGIGMSAADSRSWLGYILDAGADEGWSAAMIDAAGEGIIRAVQLGEDPAQMALALSVTAAQAEEDQTPAQIVQSSLDFLTDSADAAELQRREAIYASMRAAVDAGVPWNVAYGLYEHALLEGWSATRTEGVLKGVQQGVEKGLPGEQLALALVVRLEQDGDPVAIDRMIREETDFIRQSLKIPEPPVKKPKPSPPPSTPVASAKTADWQSIRRSIDSFLGVPYLWGGETRQGADCSGFTQTVYGEQGVRIPRVSRDQHKHLKKSRALVGGPGGQKKLTRGDLVFFNKNGKGRITHVGMYVGDGKFAHSCCSKGVVISNFQKRYYQRLFVDGGRVCLVED